MEKKNLVLGANILANGEFVHVKQLRNGMYADVNKSGTYYRKKDLSFDATNSDTKLKDEIGLSGTIRFKTDDKGCLNAPNGVMSGSLAPQYWGNDIVAVHAVGEHNNWGAEMLHIFHKLLDAHISRNSRVVDDKVISCLVESAKRTVISLKKASEEL